jgi:hyperosmotically inducible protein
MRAGRKLYSVPFAAFALTAVLIAAAGCSSTQTVGEQFDDAGITTRITAKFVADPQINPFNINVDTRNGVVTLRGEVEHAVAKSEAEKLARDTGGVIGVVNEIVVVPQSGG